MTWTGHTQRRGRSAAYCELRERVLARDNYECQVRIPGVCTSVGNTLDHIIAVAEGGAFLDPANCRAACKPCNTALGRRVGGRRTRMLTRQWSRAW